MSKEEEQANKLIEQYIELTPVEYGLNDTPEMVRVKNELDIQVCIKCALIDNQNTIDALEVIYLTEATSTESMSILKGIFDLKCFHQAVRTILKSKLK